jgi:hypothetical protein
MFCPIRTEGWKMTGVITFPSEQMFLNPSKSNLIMPLLRKTMNTSSIMMSEKVTEATTKHANLSPFPIMGKISIFPGYDLCPSNILTHHHSRFFHDYP